ncbi:MAG: transcriptional regulator, AraC family [Ferruginibacter sp.]|nr:transcriptional regulator, AraC family [Ferruginibacter sp.]
MVSARCKIVAKEELKKLGLHYVMVDLGEVEIMETLSEDMRATLKSGLLQSGLELMDDKRSMLIEKIKNIVIEVVHYLDEPLRVNFSDYLGKKLNHDYTYLSNLFSEVQGTTIEHFLIAHKIEKVKEFLVYNELTLTEIAYKMNYSSVGHLSNQFKKVTGLTPSHFKKMKNKRRNALENI